MKKIIVVMMLLFVACATAKENKTAPAMTAADAWSNWTATLDKFAAGNDAANIWNAAIAVMKTNPDQLENLASDISERIQDKGEAFKDHLQQSWEQKTTAAQKATLTNKDGKRESLYKMAVRLATKGN